jgi:hypothetical protein
VHLTRFGFNSIVLVWLVPALIMSIYGNTVSTGVASDIYYWMTGIDAGLILYALFQLFRSDDTMSVKEAARRKNDSHDEVVSFENLGSIEYIYCAVLVILAVGSWWFHHSINKDSTGILSIATLIWSWLDLLIAVVSAFQFYRLKSGAIVEVSKKLVAN